MRQAPKRDRKPIIEMRPEVWDEAIKKLIHDNSPEQISKTFKAEHADEPLNWISHETIYKYIYALPKSELRKLITFHLRSKRKLKMDRSLSHAQRGQIPDATSISEKPQEVDARLVPGQWEGDLILGKNHKIALCTLVERTTRLVILVPIKGAKNAKTVEMPLQRYFRR